MGSRRKQIKDSLAIHNTAEKALLQHIIKICSGKFNLIYLLKTGTKGFLVLAEPCHINVRAHIRQATDCFAAAIIYCKLASNKLMFSVFMG